MNLNNLQTILDKVEKEGKSFTPFGLCKLVNRELGTNLPPQMFYNYISHKNKDGVPYLSANKVDGKWNITNKEARRWIEKYSLNNIVTSIN